MDTFTFVATLVGHLAWPVTAVVGFFILKKEVLSRVGKLRIFEFKGAKFDFDERLDAIEEKVALSLPEVEKAVPKLPKPVDSPSTERFERVLDIAPEMAIIEAWLTIEERLKAVAMEKGYGTRARSMTFIIRELRRDGVLDAKTATFVEELRLLRNEILHRPQSVTISKEDARRYYELAEITIQNLQF